VIIDVTENVELLAPQELMRGNTMANAASERPTRSCGCE